MTADEISALVDRLSGVWYSALVRYGARLTGSADLAQDLAQEAFLLLFCALQKGKAITFPKAWTLRVMKRQASRQLRYEKHRGIVFEPIESAAAVCDTWRPVPGEGLDQFSQFVSLLTAREEEVLLLRLEGLRYREIAHELDVSLGTVKALLARAVRKIQEAQHTGEKSTLNDPYGYRESRSSE